MKTKVHFLQTYIVLLSGIAATLLPVSCSQADSPSAGVTTDASTGETSRVEILIPRNLTRTYISDDEGEDLENDDYEGKRAVVEWNEGDQLVMWSKALTDGSTLSAPATFTYLAPSFNVEYDGILFYCDNVEIPATLSTYSYYAVSPVPDNADDRYAYFTIPAEQCGRYDHDYKGAVPDILWAPPVQGKRLMQDVRNPIDFSFKHMLHTMKITVPEVPFDDGIKQMRIEFPYNVAGKLRIDLESGETLLTEGSNAITLTFDTPKKAGDTFWVFVAPYDAAGSTGSGKVHFIATDGTDFTFPKESDAFDFSKFTACSITPVRLRNLTVHPSVDFTVTMQDNHLGEDVDALLTLPDNGSENNVFAMLEESKTRKIHFVGKSQDVTIRMYEEVLERIQTRTLTVKLESEHAEGFDVSNTVASDKFAFTVPYLYAEDFSSTTKDNELDYSTQNVTHGDATWYDTSDKKLEDEGFPSGWEGGRCGVKSKTAVRVWNRSQNVWALVRVTGEYRGILDSPTMNHLKADATVKLNISFNYSMNREGINNKTNFTQHYFSVGVHKNERNEDGKNKLNSLLNQTLNKDGLGNGFTGDITAVETDIYTTDFTGSYTHIDKSWGATTDAICTRDSRFVWSVYCNQTVGDGYYNMLLYLDNIKVSIVP